ncbi:MAG: L-threonylcarbamoyladenylate synthase [Bacillota bacterium]|nr:L-threonylcarbamoyladenylate synthase [Bacillota bacterium]
METEVAILNEEDINSICESNSHETAKAIKYIVRAGEVIRDGGLVAFPTETVYGLGANALDSDAVKKIFEAKGRPQDNPLIVHVADFDILPFVKNIPEIGEKLMKSFWPGPLTLIFEKSDIIPNTTSAGLPSVGIRMPSNVIAREIIKAAMVPIAAPSANISGRPSPTDVERCIEDLDGKIDFILGGSECEVGLESTIVDCTVDPPCVLRPGGITLEMLKEIDSRIYIDPMIMKKPNKDFKPKAPGMKYRHYAPKAPLKIIEGNLEKTIEKINEMVQNYKDEDKIVGIMCTDETMNSYIIPNTSKLEQNNPIIISLGSRKRIKMIGRNLFEVLRKFDDLNVDIIISEAFDEKEMGIAIMNRLNKSAGFDILVV